MLLLLLLLLSSTSLKAFNLILLTICITLMVTVNGKDVVIKSKDTIVVFTYREGIEGESGLHECEFNEACNIVHNRYWMPTLTERLCRCPGGHECPWNWNYARAGIGNSSSMNVNNRSVLQFCETAQLKMRKICSHKESAVTVVGQGDSSNSFIHPHVVKANCICPKLFFWKLQKFKYEANDNTVLQVYKCAKQWMCDSLDFCGHVRPDLFSVYYRCTCPEKHWCIFTNKTQQSQENVQELVYSGAAYKARARCHIENLSVRFAIPLLYMNQIILTLPSVILHA